MIMLVFFFMYQLLQVIFTPVIIIYFIFRLTKKKPLGLWCERLGFVPRPKPDKPILWIHAVSVGEVLSIEYFIKNYKNEHPNHRCYLTVGTLGGMKMAKKLDADYISYIPFDALFSTYIAMNRIQPRLLIIVEAEIWPNLIMLTHFKKIPLYLLNGRINKKSAKKRRFLGFLYKLFTHLFVQSEYDTQAFRSMGISPHTISLLGDIKTYNVVEKKQELLSLQDKFTKKLQYPYTIVLVGSVHAGEVDIYIDAFLNLKSQLPQLKLILVPRHFNWQQDLINKLKSKAVSFHLWTDATPTLEQLHDHEEHLNNVFNSNDVLVVCKLGILFYLYPFAAVYCLGGTFIPVGGHNLLEPAVWENPCIIGPYFHKCSDVANALYTVGGLVKVTTNVELQSVLSHLATHEKERKQMGAANIQWLNRQAHFTKQLLILFIKNQ
jgi:3-deoxy-D-manno-octulosonic-acid transferase